MVDIIINSVLFYVVQVAYTPLNCINLFNTLYIFMFLVGFLVGLVGLVVGYNLSLFFA